MTPLDIPTLRALAAAARERADKATAGPWRTNGPCVLSARQGGDLVCSVAGQESPEERLSTLRFIAAARTDVPALADALGAALDEVRRLRNVESAALAWRGVARCPDHAETMYWCDSCVRSEDADEALADALNAGRGNK